MLFWCYNRAGLEKFTPFLMVSQWELFITVNLAESNFKEFCMAKE